MIETQGPLRLVAQDIGFSVREQGFDSPRGYYINPPEFAILGRNEARAPVFQGFFHFLGQMARIVCHLRDGVNLHLNLLSRIDDRVGSQNDPNAIAVH